MIASDGLMKTVGAVFMRLYRRVRPPVAVQHPFDIQHGVDTSGLILGRKLRSKHANARHITAYWGTAPSMFPALMEGWQATLPNGLGLQDYGFLDIGCGKGRVLMLASDFPFRQVAGVELSGALAEIAERNLSIWMASGHVCKSVHVFQADALTYDLPAGPLLIYLFNPFDKPLVERFVDRLMACSADRPHPIDVLYVFPFHADCFARFPAVELLWSEDIPFNAEDAAADVFESRKELCNLYRISSNEHPKGQAN